MEEIIKNIKDKINNQQFCEAEHDLLDILQSPKETYKTYYQTVINLLLLCYVKQDKYQQFYELLASLINEKPYNAYYLLYMRLLRFFIPISEYHNGIVHGNTLHVVKGITNVSDGNVHYYETAITEIYGKRMTIAEEHMQKWCDSLDSESALKDKDQIVYDLLKKANIAHQKRELEKNLFYDRITKFAENEEYQAIVDLLQEESKKWPLSNADRYIMILAKRLLLPYLTYNPRYIGTTIWSAIDAGNYYLALMLCSTYERKRGINRGPLYVLIEKAFNKCEPDRSDSNKDNINHPAMSLIESLMDEKKYSEAFDMIMKHYPRSHESNEILLGANRRLDVHLMYCLVQLQKYDELIALLQNLKNKRPLLIREVYILYLAYLIQNPSDCIYQDNSYNPSDTIFDMIDMNQFKRALTLSCEYNFQHHRKFESLQRLLKIANEKTSSVRKNYAVYSDNIGYQEVKNYQLYFDKMKNTLKKEEDIIIFPTSTVLQTQIFYRALEEDLELSVYELDQDGQKFLAVHYNSLSVEDHKDADVLYMQAVGFFEKKEYEKCYPLFSQLLRISQNDDYKIYYYLGLTYYHLYENSTDPRLLEKAIIVLEVGRSIAEKKASDDLNSINSLLRNLKSKLNAMPKNKDLSVYLQPDKTDIVSLTRALSSMK